MQPVALLRERGRFIVVRRCTGCGATRWCRAAADDDVDRLLG